MTQNHADQIVSTARALDAQTGAVINQLGAARAEAESILAGARARLGEEIALTRGVFSAHNTAVDAMLEGLGADLEGLLGPGPATIPIPMPAPSEEVATAANDGLPTARQAARMSKAELLALALGRGIAVPEGATKGDIVALLDLAD